MNFKEKYKEIETKLELEHLLYISQGEISGLWAYSIVSAHLFASKYIDKYKLESRVNLTNGRKNENIAASEILTKLDPKSKTYKLCKILLNGRIHQFNFMESNYYVPNINRDLHFILKSYKFINDEEQKLLEKTTKLFLNDYILTLKYFSNLVNFHLLLDFVNLGPEISEYLINSIVNILKNNSSSISVVSTCEVLECFSLFTKNSSTLYEIFKLTSLNEKYTTKYLGSINPEFKKLLLII